MSAPRIAGLSYLLSFVIVVYANFAIHDRLIVPNDATQTAANILEHERQFRTGIVLDLLYCAGLLLLIAALYVILAPVNRTLALSSTLMKLAYALAWMLTTMTFFDALRLAHGTPYLRVFEPSKLLALARMYLAGRFDRYYGGLLFYSLGAVLSSYLWLRSAFIPRALSMFGIAACAWCTACTAIFLVVPTFSNSVNLWWFDTPMALFDLATSFWLIFKGVRRIDATN